MREPKYYFEDEVFSKDYLFEHLYDDELLEQILILVEQGKSLELACGEAGNSLALASFDFDATCIDISKTAIKAIKEEAKQREVKIKAIKADLETYKIKDKYDVIFGSGFFHFLDEENAEKLIQQVKEHTKSGGVNIFEVLLEGDITQDQNPNGCYFSEKKLRELYKDWEVLDYVEFESEDEEEDCENLIAKIVAKKK